MLKINSKFHWSDSQAYNISTQVLIVTFRASDQVFNFKLLERYCYRNMRSESELERQWSENANNNEKHGPSKQNNKVLHDLKRDALLECVILYGEHLLFGTEHPSCQKL